MASSLPSQEKILDIPFSYDGLPNDQPFIRLLILLPGVAWEGGGDPLKCLLTTHNWDPEMGFIRHLGGNVTESPLVSQETVNDEPFCKSVQQEINYLTQQCCNGKRCACLTYEALSYEWGDAEFRDRISLNKQTFGVTQTLQQALYHLRHASAVRRLWVDAICINQKSDEDKAKQIQQMNHIYKNAIQVVSWLGLPVKNGNLAFEFAKKLYATACTALDLKRGTEGELYIDKSQWLSIERYLSIRKNFLHSSYANEWLALHWIFKRRYWARAWVFQEVILAKRVCFICGTKSMTWGVMELAMQLVRVNPQEIVDLVNSSIPIPDQNTLSPVTQDDPHYFQPHYRGTLVGFLEGRRYRKNVGITETPAHATEILLELIQVRFCKLQHDLIYSILGLVPFSIASVMPEPNYGQPVTEVFKQFAKSFVVGTQSLNILCYSHYSDTQDDLPSWVFDWRRQERLAQIHDFAGYIGTKAHRKWHTLNVSNYIPTFPDDGATISIYGISYGTVTQIKLEEKHFQNMRKLTKRAEETDASGVSRSHHESHERVWWLFEEDASALLGGAPPESPMLRNDQASTLLYLLLSIRDPERLTGSTKQKQTRWSKPNNFHDVYVAMQSTTVCRVAFETDNGDIGLAPMWTQPGDVLCQFFGCTAAFILRKVDNQQYQFVGNCYVLEKMGWDAIKLLEAGIENNAIQMFTLI